MKIKQRSIALLLSVFLFALGTLTAQAQQSKLTRDDSIKYACLAANGDEKWCQCQNDYYASFLTDADWKKYTNDYYALVRFRNSKKSTPANSYARYVKLGNAHCQRCNQDNFQGCLNDDGVTPSTAAYQRILNDLRDGQFKQLQNNVLFKNFFVDYVLGYSAFCGNRISDWTERTIVRTEWTSTNHVWWQSDQSTSVTRVDKRLYQRYLSYESAASDNMIGDLIRGYLEAAGKRELPTKLFGQTMKRIVEPVVFMRGHLQGRCSAPDVKAVYENLHRFSAGQDARVDPAFAVARAKAEQQRQQRQNDIIAATKVSRERSIKIIAEQREVEALKPKTSFSCDAERKEALAAATGTVNFVGQPGTSFEHLVGAWRGTFNDEDMELAIWSYPSGNAAIGFSYFPKYDCLMSVIMSGEGRRPQGGYGAHMELRMYSPNWRGGNCESMVVEDRDREIHRFGARGYLMFESEAKSFTWSPYVGKLSRLAPQSCSNLDVEFQAGKVSTQFHQLLQQFDYPDKRAVKMPANFLNEIR